MDQYAALTEECGCSDTLAVETAAPEQVDTPTDSMSWSGVIGVEGHPTGDGRLIEPGALTWDELPIPLRYVPSDSGAHDGAVVVGTIETLERDEETGEIRGTGTFDMGSEIGREAARQVSQGLTTGVSMDLDDVSYEERVASAVIDALAPSVDTTSDKPEFEVDSEGRAIVAQRNAGDEMRVTTEGRIRAATIVAIPAFSQAKLSTDGAFEDTSDEDDTPDEDTDLDELTDEDREAIEEATADPDDLPDLDTEDEDEEDAASDNPSPYATYNWVDDVGGLPRYIKRISRHLRRKGMTESHAIAVAVNAVKRMCATGDLNFPGKQDVNPGSRAQACAAVASWEAKKARARATSAATETLREVSTEERRDLAEKGHALPDGSFPIANCEDLKNAIQSIGRASDRDAAISHIKKRANALDCEDVDLPDDWASGNDHDLTPGILVASATPVKNLPPAEWFADPQLTEPTPIRVTDDGRIYGHLAAWGTCHISHTAPGKCVTPPQSPSSYAYYRVGATHARTPGNDVAEIPTGVIFMDTTHAGPSASAMQTLAHYENTGSAVADVAAGEDAHGIWVAGAVRPNVSDEQRRALRAAPLSGDWREIQGHLELVAALAVNVPGFPIPRPAGHVRSGRMTAMTASGMLAPRKVRPSQLSADDIHYLKALAQREREHQAAVLASRSRSALARINARKNEEKVRAFAAKRASSETTEKEN